MCSLSDINIRPLQLEETAVLEALLYTAIYQADSKNPLKKSHYAQISLSVQKKNGAWKLYEKIGFKVVRECGEDCIMRLKI